jgi:hypothetical protein
MTSKAQPKTRQVSLDSFLKTGLKTVFTESDSAPIKSDIDRLIDRRRLRFAILDVVANSPDGILDSDLVKELKDKNIECVSSSVNTIGGNLAKRGIIKRETWDEKVYYGLYRSKIRRYKYYHA